LSEAQRRENRQNSEQHHLASAGDRLEPDGRSEADRATARERDQRGNRGLSRITGPEGETQQQGKRQQHDQVVVAHTQDETARGRPLGFDLTERHERCTGRAGNRECRRDHPEAPVAA
jgi:hypothetical protein